MKNQLPAVLAGAGLMVVCCLLPMILLGGGAAGIFAWIGGLNGVLILAAVVGGGALAYYVIGRARVTADRCQKLAVSAPAATPDNSERKHQGFVARQNSDPIRENPRQHISAAKE